MSSELARLLKAEMDKPPEPPKFGGGSLEDIFDEEPCGLMTFLNDKKFLNLGLTLSEYQMNALMHMERIYFDGWEIDDDGNRYYDPDRDLYSKMIGGGFSHHWSQKVRIVNFLTLQWGLW